MIQLLYISIPTLGVLGNLTVVLHYQYMLKRDRNHQKLEDVVRFNKNENLQDFISPYLQPSPTLPRETGILTREVSREFDIISKPKNVSVNRGE